jgi:hypothetical protein
MGKLHAPHSATESLSRSVEAPGSIILVYVIGAVHASQNATRGNR